MTAEPDVKTTIAVQMKVPTGDLALNVTFSYRTCDPYAVCTGFHVGLDEPVEWTFARSLLRQGLECAAGLGDVRIWPQADGLVSIEISSPFGQARFLALAREVEGFLRSTDALVPAGREAIDVDAEIAALLGQGGAR